ncbi:MAG: hypothetical protein GY750_18720, partial [Lentisphaerae bacterium]|nr:hypothetical protein [Lentisphaerota bacterium]MCP4103432.1 hypothetical protein [Lentisphaerota bacterium]
MKVQEVCNKHSISHKNVLKHCQRGRFLLDGLVYTAEDISKPDSRNAKWEITPLEGEQPELDASFAKIKLQLTKQRHLETQIKKLEQTIMEKRIHVFEEFIDLNTRLLVKDLAPLKEFVIEHIDEKEHENWNQLV